MLKKHKILSNAIDKPNGDGIRPWLEIAELTSDGRGDCLGLIPRVGSPKVCCKGISLVDGRWWRCKRVDWETFCAECCCFNKEDKSSCCLWYWRTADKKLNK